MTDTPPTTAPEIVDLDAARAARDEKQKPAPMVRLGGIDYTLPAEIDASVLVSFGALGDALAGDITPADAIKLEETVGLIFGPSWEPLKAAAAAAGRPLSLEDWAFLLDRVLAAYGMSLPESGASGAS